MTSINIKECHRCNPEKWIQVGPSSATYFCLKCRKLVNQILEWLPFGREEEKK